MVMREVLAEKEATVSSRTAAEDHGPFPLSANQRVFNCNSLPKRVRARHMSYGRECVCERRAEVATCAGSYSAESSQHGVRMRARRVSVLSMRTSRTSSSVKSWSAWHCLLESSGTVAVAEGL